LVPVGAEMDWQGLERHIVDHQGAYSFVVAVIVMGVAWVRNALECAHPAAVPSRSQPERGTHRWDLRALNRDYGSAGPRRSPRGGTSA